LSTDQAFPEGVTTGGLRAQAPTLGLLIADGGFELSGRIANGSFSPGGAAHISWGDLELTASRESGAPGGEDSFAVLVTAQKARGNPAKDGGESGGSVLWRVPEVRVSLEGALVSRAGGLEFNNVRYELGATGAQKQWSLPGTKRLRKGLGDLKLESSGAFDLDVQGRRIVVRDMAVEGMGLVVTGQGIIDYGEAWSVSGKLGLPEFALRVCMAHLGIEPPRGIEPGLLAACGAQAEVEVRPGWIRFHNIDLCLDQSKGRGEITFSEVLKGRPEWGISYDLRFDALDADRYLFGHPHPQTAVQATQKPRPWDLGWLKDMRSRGRLRIGELELFDLNYHNVDLTAEARDGVFTLEPFTAGFYNGMLRLGIRGEVRQTLHMTVNIELQQFDLLGVLRKVGDWDRMGGNTSIVMHLASQGLSSAAHLLTLSGGGDVRVENGFYAYTKETVKTENEKMLWREFYENQKTDSESEAEEETVEQQRVVIPVRTATATIQIGNGIFRNEDFIARGEKMTATGSGTMNIPLGSLDYIILVDAKVIPVFPIHIKGPLADPAVEEGEVGFVETLFTTFRNILTIPFSAMDAISRQARQFQEGQESAQPGSANE
ncbi:MAG: AsmA-like C-terminal region-containing protein, partial [Oceanidesulfovibrio sp.]